MLIVFHTIVAGVSSLAEILRYHGSDKVSHHHYDKAYEPLFEKLRYEPTTLLEIGVQGGFSMASWAEYFTHPSSKIIGLAYKNKQRERLDDRRISIEYGNQNDKAVQEKLSRKGNYTIIIDDGSHVPSHQWNTFKALWPSLQPGGLYIVEDIETNYWSTSSSVYGNKLRSERNIIGRFKEMIDMAVNAEFSTGVDDSDLESISFYRNCIILRKHNASHKPRKYRFRVSLKGKKLAND